MRILFVTIIILIIFFSISRSEEPTTINPMITRPEWYINISDWSFYVAWGGVALINNVTIENTSNLGYRNIKVKVLYYSMLGSNYGIQIGQEIGYLPITLPPKKQKYLSQRGCCSWTRFYEPKGWKYTGIGGRTDNPLGIRLLLFLNLIDSVRVMKMFSEI